jgi:hypothetical protein
VELLLHPDRQGRGLVTEAAMALLGIAALPRVLAPRNVAGSGYGSRTR